MSVPKDKYRFITSIAQLAQDIMRRDVEVKVDDAGVAKIFRPGLSGKVLDALYAKRLEALMDGVRATPLGCAVLDFLQEREVCVSFDHRMSARGTADLHRTIRLNPGARNAELVGTIVHEARHIWQFERLRAQLTAILPPEAHAANMVYIEADAFSFQQKFLEDYAQRTGDGAPLSVYLKQHRKNQAPLGLDDKGRFLLYAAKLRESLVYNERTLDLINYDVARLEKAPAGVIVPARASSGVISLQVARGLGLSWPFKDEQGQTPDYLASVSDEDLLAVGRASKWLSWEMVPPALSYDRLRAAKIAVEQAPPALKKHAI